MLILTRRVGETVVVGDDITITILGIQDNKVRVGINAPRNIPVHRSEIYERIKAEHTMRARTKIATAERAPESAGQVPAGESAK